MRARLGQAGTTTVEFAIVGVVLLVILFAVIEFGRIVFTLHLLQEGARRAARVAAVCPVSDLAINGKAQLSTLQAVNVDVAYLPDAAQPRFVRVSISGYVMSINIPFISPDFEAPTFSATLPTESLGVPGYGAAPPCSL